MINNSHIPESKITEEEEEAALDAAPSIVDEVERGKITREKAKKKLVAIGSTPDWASKFLLHTLDQDKLDAERARTGRIVD